MEALILDEEWETVAVLDTFQSFIWSDRYRGYGDFEVYLPASHPISENFKMGYYLMLHGSDRLMVIETIEIDTDAEDGDKMTVTGRSLESFLDRRIVWERTTLSGKLPEAIEKLLNENAINPNFSMRKIPNLIFKTPTDSRIKTLEVDTQFYGDNLYDAINSLCEEADVGFCIRPDFDNHNMIFELYKGEDRSYDQEELPWVVFSPKYENLMSTKYIESKVDLKNIALILGTEIPETEEETASPAPAGDSYTSMVGDYDASGLNRREMFVDASSTSDRYYDSDLGESVRLDYGEYISILDSKGSEALSNKKETASFSGEIVQTSQFTLNEDFFIGDIVQIDNNYGKELKVTISEIVFSQDESGESVMPTFSAIEGDANNA